MTVLAACDSEGESQRVTAKGAVTGRAALTFAGAVTGQADGPADVACWKPAKKGDRFTVQIDSEHGLAVSGATTKLRALDVAVAGYDKPGVYDLSRSVASDGIDRDDFFLVFDVDPNPFGWGGEGSEGTLTIDPGAASGRVAITGWHNADGQTIDVQGTFRCGKGPGTG